MKFISDVTFPSWPDHSVNPNFPQYQSDRKKKTNSIFAWKFNQKRLQESLLAP